MSGQTNDLTIDLSYVVLNGDSPYDPSYISITGQADPSQSGVLSIPATITHSGTVYLLMHLKLDLLTIQQLLV